MNSSIGGEMLMVESIHKSHQEHFHNLMMVVDHQIDPFHPASMMMTNHHPQFHRSYSYDPTTVKSSFHQNKIEPQPLQQQFGLDQYGSSDQSSCYYYHNQVHAHPTQQQPQYNSSCSTSSLSPHSSSSISSSSPSSASSSFMNGVHHHHRSPSCSSSYSAPSSPYCGNNTNNLPQHVNLNNNNNQQPQPDESFSMLYTSDGNENYFLLDDAQHSQLNHLNQDQQSIVDYHGQHSHQISPYSTSDIQYDAIHNSSSSPSTTMATINEFGNMNNNNVIVDVFDIKREQRDDEDSNEERQQQQSDVLPQNDDKHGILFDESASITTTTTPLMTPPLSPDNEPSFQMFHQTSSKLTEQIPESPSSLIPYSLIDQNSESKQVDEKISSSSSSPSSSASSGIIGKQRRTRGQKKSILKTTSEHSTVTTTSTSPTLSGGTRQSQKRSAHLSAEFRYRTKLNEKINKLRNLVSKQKHNLSKSAVLTRSIEMIVKLQKLTIQLHGSNVQLQRMLAKHQQQQQQQQFGTSKLVEKTENDVDGRSELNDHQTLTMMMKNEQSDP